MAFDVDGTADSFPRETQSMISAFTAAGFHVYIITGVDEPVATEADASAKREYLTGLGISSDTYYELIVSPQPHPENKLKAIEDNAIDVLFDNSKGNCRAAKDVCAAFLLWNSKTD